MEIKYWRITLDGYLDKRKNQMGCKERKEWYQGCKGKKIKKEEIEEEEIKETIRKKIEEKIEKGIKR